ncbi:MAG: hypothetical protein JNK21_16700 [Rhodospirillaceae bacterium]|nr:hypothetical protein [Rhodospirillaceae bacterium]
MNTLRQWVTKLASWRRGNDVADAVSSEFTLGFGPDDVRPSITWDQDIDLTLNSLVNEATTKASGRVQVLTVAHLRAELGEAWDRYKKHVLLIAETTIGRMIGKGNTYIQQDEDSWLLLMPSLSEHEAQLKADDIAMVLGEKLVGERFAEQEPPLPQTAKVDLGAALNPDGSFNSDALRASVKRARIMLAARDARRPAQELDKAKTAAKPQEKAMGTAASFSQASLFPALTLAYRPLWQADTESFSGFALRAFTDTGEPVFGPNALPSVQAMLNDATIIDLAKAAFGDFTAMTQKNMRATYILPVPFSVMTRKLGAVFLRALAALPQKERLTYMRIEIVNVPLRTPVSTLVTVRDLFRGRVKDVGFLMDLGQINNEVMALDHVVIEAEPHADMFGNEQFLHESMSFFRRRAAARRCAVMGLRTRAQAGFALHAGIDEISGTGIADDLRHLPDRTTVVYKQELVRGPASREATF